ncbi:MAG: hypothetical protein WEA80_01975 [Gemmatimonadaceae bacterium]
MPATLARTAPASNHQLHPLVEIERVEELLASKIVKISRAAAWGRRSAEIRQLEKDVLHRRTRAFRTTARLLLSAQDNGVELSEALEFPQLLTAVLRNRQEEAPHLAFNEFHFLETQIECAINPVQVAMMQGDTSRPRKQQLHGLLVRNIEILQQMQRMLELDLYDLQEAPR